MAKPRKQLTAEQKKAKRMQKLSRDYALVDSELQIEGLNMYEQVHRIVRAACDVQKLICEAADKIKIDDYDKVTELTAIDKQTYNDFVRVASLKSVDKLKDKAIAKFESDFENRLLQTNLRKTFFDTYISGEELKITDEDNREFEQFEGYLSDEFSNILEDSAQTRTYINTTLRSRYKQLSNAAIYATDERLSAKEFKQLVDWEYYKDGCYPTETSPSKIWDIYNKFNQAWRLLNKWQYTGTSDELLWEFGLGVVETIPHPVDHPWMVKETIDSEEE